ncbi:60S ribosomal protein L24 [Malassezia cuniculi]|uniref:60S ribosomal protein L24 n=1 Tax=Malassezia cuniculi TaxID=948313 RepID=A0AAF0J4V2_9BASI|nr:60S ribosomal protein L24 [Malassezia cuniculi]
MKVEICSFSNRKIYPGKGKLYVRGDSKVFRFQTSKSESLFLQRKNPRKIAWTVLYRKMHKKGITEETQKRRTRRTVKSQRGVVGASLDSINQLRNQRPEVREAARKEKEQKTKEARKARKAAKAQNQALGAGGAKVSRQQAKGGARAGGLKA